jgi:hypothetical protein
MDNLYMNIMRGTAHWLEEVRGQEICVMVADENVVCGAIYLVPQDENISCTDSV